MNSQPGIPPGLETMPSIRQCTLSNHTKSHFNKLESYMEHEVNSVLWLEILRSIRRHVMQWRIMCSMIKRSVMV